MECPTWFEKLDPQTVFAIEKGLKILVAPVPSKKGFPFDLPVVEWVTKLIPGKIFLQRSLNYFNVLLISNPLVEILQESLELLETILSEDTLWLLRQLKTLFTKFVRLRQILVNHESSSKLIKKQLGLFMNQLKKHAIRFPKCQVIIKRLKKYWNYLFHGYDDKRIPLTNLEIERSFNRLKRILRKRTGYHSRQYFFIMEGEALLIIEPLLRDLGPSISQKDFISHFTLQRNLISTADLKIRFSTSQQKRKQMKQSYSQKYQLKSATSEFKSLIECFSLI